MILSFSIDPNKMIDMCHENEFDIYDFINKKGFNHEFNWANYKNNEVLISEYSTKFPTPPTSLSGSLFYVIEFHEHKENIYMESISDDRIRINYEPSDEQLKLIDDLESRISVLDLEIADPERREITSLYGFCVDYIPSKNILSWSVYMILSDGSKKLLFKENQRNQRNKRKIK